MTEDLSPHIIPDLSGTWGAQPKHRNDIADELDFINLYLALNWY